MRMLDLFSGIGGFSLAASWVWGDELEIVAFVEIDKFCQKVLKKHWPNVPIIEDIRTLKGDQFGTIDLITGGFPCQPFSQAGKRRGKNDDRFLWPEMLRVISEARPTWVIGENVVGISTMEFDKMLSEMEGLQYSTQALIIPACSINSPQNRERVWIISHSGGRGFDVSIKNCQKYEKICHQWPTDSLIQTTPNEFCRTVEDHRMLRTLDGIPYGVDRLKSLGNAIVPQVVYEIMKGIRQAGILEGG